MSNNTFGGNAAGDTGGAIVYKYQCVNSSTVPGERIQRNRVDELPLGTCLLDREALGKTMMLCHCSADT